MRICCKCKNEKPLEDFPWKNKAQGIKQGYCKECKKAYNKTWYAKESNRQAQIDRASVRKKEQYLKYAQWKSDYVLSRGGCSWEGCNVTDPVMIEFDHTNPEFKVENISNLMSKCVSIETLELEVSKCTLLCANHHKKRTASQFGWTLETLK